MKAAASTRPAETPPATVVEIGGVPLAFGLEWQPVARAGDPRAELRQAREAGFRLVARLPDGSLLGLARRVDGARRAHSAVALLIARFAEQGAEVCLIAVDERVALVGLMDRRPVPGFDRLLPDLAAAQALLAEFRDMHPDRPVRVASHLPGRERLGDALPLAMLFDQPDPETRLRPLPGEQRRAAWCAAAVAATLLAAGATVVWRLQAQARERALAERTQADARAAAARAARERAERIDGALVAAGPPGNATLDRWRAAVAALPLSRAGWTLQRIACRGGAGCVATWARHHGTLAQLDAAATTALVIDREPGADRLAMPMREALAVRAPGDAPAPALRAGALPPLRDAVVDWGSRLQDLMLVGGGQATLDTGTALEPPGSGHPAAVAPDVLRLGWRLRDGLWSLPFLQLPPYVVADSLVVTLGATHITYELSGSLFALGPSP